MGDRESRVRAALEEVLESIDSGELSATEVQRAYIAGAIEGLANPPAPDSQ